MTQPRKPSYLDFDKGNYPWKPHINYREAPEAYRIGKGEQGVLICEPYKTEIGKHWRFKTPEIATKSSEEIFNLFQDYLNKNDFVGADMAWKFLQMGYTRATRYANYEGSKKYNKENDYASSSGEQGKQKKRNQQPFFTKNGKLLKPIMSMLKGNRNGKKNTVNLLSKSKIPPSAAPAIPYCKFLQ